MHCGWESKSESKKVVPDFGAPTTKTGCKVSKEGASSELTLIINSLFYQPLGGVTHVIVTSDLASGSRRGERNESDGHIKLSVKVSIPSGRVSL
jgi:hypothetical protein